MYPRSPGWEPLRLRFMRDCFCEGVPYAGNPVEKEMVRERVCYERFDQGVEKLDCAEMWCDYFDLSLKLHNQSQPDTAEAIRDRRKSKFFEVAHRAHRKGMLATSRYLTYVDVLLAHGLVPAALQVLEEIASDRQEPRLALKHLQVALLTSSCSETDNVIDPDPLLDKAAKLAPNMSRDEQRTFADMWMQLLISRGDEPQARAALGEMLVTCGRETTICAQELFLTWHAGMHGVDSAYKVSVGVA